MTNFSNLINTLSPAERKFVRLIDALDGQAWIVGGAVRDAICGRPSKDIDLEISGVSVETLETLPNWVVQPAGDRFAVWLVSPEPDFNHGEFFEVCVPHVRVKTGAGRMDETAIIDTDLDIAVSLGRRDFTCNAMAVNAVTGEFVDPFDGQGDLMHGILRAINADNFADDPVRVLRGMRFASTHGLAASQETVQAASQNVAGGIHLDDNRQRQEWVKWAGGSHPHLGIQFLRDAGWLVHWPILGNLDGIAQHPVWHPEGDVLTHTILALQALNNSNPITVWATLLHDIGKAEAQDEDGTAYGHDDIGAEMVVDFFHSIGFQWSRPPEWVHAVAAIVREHMRAASWGVEISARAVRRLAGAVEPATIRQWAAVCMADTMGREDASHVDEAVVIVAEIASRQVIIDNGPAPIIGGRHLIEAGFSPGPRMGEIIRAANAEHVEMPFDNVDDAIHWVTCNFEVR
jgi:tRNA nucleotidyltransferase (CCA-adding enzyme)